MSLLCLIIGHDYERTDFGSGWASETCTRCGHSVSRCRIAYDERLETVARVHDRDYGDGDASQRERWNGHDVSGGQSR